MRVCFIGEKREMDLVTNCSSSGVSSGVGQGIRYVLLHDRFHFERLGLQPANSDEILSRKVRTSIYTF